MKRFQKFLPLILSIILLIVGCAKQEEVERIMEDGVEVVINHLEPYTIEGEPNALTLDREYVLDLERPDYVELSITEIIGFDVDSEGSIYFMILRSKKDFIFKFEKKGTYLFSFGRRGQGPGELSAPRYLTVDEMDRINVSDLGSRKIYVFRNNGDFIKEIPLASDHRIATLLGNGNILALKLIYKPEEGINEFPLVLCNEGLEVIKTLDPGQHTYNWNVAKKMNGLELYLDYNVLRVSNGLIYVGHSDKGYEFSIYDTEGILQRKIRKEYRRVEVSAQVKKEVFEGLRSRPSLEQNKDKVYFPEFYPPFQFFFLEESGRLYVMTHEKGKYPNSFLYDIFSPDGLFIGRIELDNYGSSLFSFAGVPVPLNVVTQNNRIYSLREKESGYKELVVYNMRWE